MPDWGKLDDAAVMLKPKIIRFLNVAKEQAPSHCPDGSGFGDSGNFTILSQGHENVQKSAIL
jgi:hypothetical protein